MRRVLKTSRISRTSGFTLIEAAISTVIVAVMMTAALTSVARTGNFRRIQNDRQKAHLLATQLVSEILSKSYWDPALTSTGSLGASSDELATGNRSLFDDVDDYTGWIESPPKLAGGSSLPNVADWYRKVDVVLVSWTDLNSAVSFDYGLKRISVEVGRVRAGGSVSVAGDRIPVDSVVALAGLGRGI